MPFLALVSLASLSSRQILTVTSLALLTLLGVQDNAVLIALGLSALLSQSRPIAAIIAMFVLAMKLGSSVLTEQALTAFLIGLMVSLLTAMMTLETSLNIAALYLMLSAIIAAVFVVTQSVSTFMTMTVLITCLASFTLYLTLSLLRCDEMLLATMALVTKPIMILLS